MIYELTYLINSESDYNEVTQKVTDLIKKLDFKIVSPGKNPFPPSLKRLSYPINHKIQAYYFTVQFENEGKDTNSLEKELRLNKNVIRYLLAKIPKEALEAKRIVLEKPEAPAQPAGPSNSPRKPMKKKSPDKKDGDGKVKIEELNKKLDEILNI